MICRQKLQDKSCPSSATLSVVRLTASCTKQLNNAITTERILGTCLSSLHSTSFGSEVRGEERRGEERRGEESAIRAAAERN
jgi:hypothetical protein